MNFSIELLLQLRIRRASTVAGVAGVAGVTPQLRQRCQRRRGGILRRPRPVEPQTIGIGSIQRRFPLLFRQFRMLLLHVTGHIQQLRQPVIIQRTGRGLPGHFRPFQPQQQQRQRRLRRPQNRQRHLRHPPAHQGRGGALQRRLRRPQNAGDRRQRRLRHPSSSGAAHPAAGDLRRPDGATSADVGLGAGDAGAPRRRSEQRPEPIVRRLASGMDQRPADGAAAPRPPSQGVAAGTGRFFPRRRRQRRPSQKQRPPGANNN